MNNYNDLNELNNLQRRLSILQNGSAITLFKSFRISGQISFKLILYVIRLISITIQAYYFYPCSNLSTGYMFSLSDNLLNSMKPDENIMFDTLNDTSSYISSIPKMVKEFVDDSLIYENKINHDYSTINFNLFYFDNQSNYQSFAYNVWSSVNTDLEFEKVAQQFARSKKLIIEISLIKAYLTKKTTYFSPSHYNVTLQITLKKSESSYIILPEMDVKFLPFNIIDNQINTSEMRLDSFDDICSQSKFDYFIIIIAILSLIYSVYDLAKRIILFMNIYNFSRRNFCYCLKFADILLFIESSHLFIVTINLLLMFSTIYKMVYANYADINYYINFNIIIGLYCLFIWSESIHYFSSIPKFDILVYSLKKSVPIQLRFVVCASIMFMAFSICGWVVFGVLHEKFDGLEKTAQTLFALFNGDDVYNTFALLGDSVPMFIRIFFYLYIFLYTFFFIFVCMNLFISIATSMLEVVTSGNEKDFDSLKTIKNILNENHHC